MGEGGEEGQRQEVSTRQHQKQPNNQPTKESPGYTKGVVEWPVPHNRRAGVVCRLIYSRLAPGRSTPQMTGRPQPLYRPPWCRITCRVA